MTKTKPYWGERLTWACVVYYCACGLLAAALDYAASGQSGHFEVASSASLSVMVWPFAVGLLAAAVAVASRPKKGLVFPAVIVLEIMFGIGVIESVVLTAG